MQRILLYYDNAIFLLNILNIIKPKLCKLQGKKIFLQLDYENTEVAYEGRPINPAVCKLSLRARLTTEYIYKVSADGHIVAKAGTNAQGFHWFQIGGVYTLPAYRNRGLAAAAVAHLINTHSADAHGFALFVKTANTAALRVYEKLGFEQCGLFRMSYWKKIKN